MGRVLIGIVIAIGLHCYWRGYYYGEIVLSTGSSVESVGMFLCLVLGRVCCSLAMMHCKKFIGPLNISSIGVWVGVVVVILFWECCVPHIGGAF